MFKKHKKARTTVGIDPRLGYLYIDLHGKQSARSVKKIASDHAKYIAQLRAHHKKVFIMFDASDIKVDDLDSEGRSVLRAISGRDIDGAAIVASGDVLESMASSAKMAAPKHPVQYFSRRSDAEVWIGQNVAAGRIRPFLSLVAAVAITIIGLLALIGWAIGNATLTSFLPGLRSTNPMSAIGLIDVGIIFFAYYLGMLRLHRIAGGVSILLGLLAFTPLHIGTLLFAHQIIAAGAPTHIADSAAICFIAVGICSLVTTTRRWPLRILGYIAVLTIFGLACFNAYGQLYARDFVYGISSNFVMSLNLAIAFQIAAFFGALLVLQRHRINLLVKITPLGWLIVIAAIILQIVGYVYWNQLTTANMHDATRSFTTQSGRLNDTVRSRIGAYTNALLGFQGFFAASDKVSQKDFSTYYDSLNLDENYPGLRSIAFIAAAKTQDVPALARSYRSDTTLFSLGNPTFTVGKLSNQPLHFFALYFSSYGQLSQSYSGVDISTIPGREEIYSSALTSNQPHASGTITFLQSPDQPAVQGFFIVVPVHSSLSSAPLGVVNANFAYDSFFSKLFGSELDSNGLSVQVDDGSTVVYDSASYASDSKSKYNWQTDIPIADHVWTLHVAADAQYGITSDTRQIQFDIVVSQVLLTALLGSMFYLQSRTRRRALALANEMTADLQHERELTMEANQKDEAIITSIGDGLIAFDTEGNVERNNHMAEQLFGVRSGGLVGKNLSTITRAYTIDGKNMPPHERPYLLALKHKKPISVKMYYERADGTRYPVELSVSPIILKGEVIGAIEVFRDITADVQLDKTKSEFVSLASHQLRTPLSAINWYAEMLLNGDGGKLNEEQTAYVQEIFDGNSRMVELVNSLLDVSRLELGRMNFEPEQIDMQKLINGLESEMKVTIKSKHMQFTKHLDETVPIVMNDRKMLQMIVQNLMSNALKYNDAGGHVAVTLRPATDSEVDHVHLPTNQPYVLFSVADNGYGIPIAQQKRIFEKMFRADNVQTLDVEGTGLGLYIVKEVVDQMGGWIGFESIEKKGTTFTAIIPVVAKEKIEKPEKEPKA